MSNYQNTSTKLICHCTRTSTTKLNPWRAYSKYLDIACVDAQRSAQSSWPEGLGDTPKNKQILAPTGYTSVRMQADFMRLIWDIFQFF